MIKTILFVLLMIPSLFAQQKLHREYIQTDCFENVLSPNTQTDAESYLETMILTKNEITFTDGTWVFDAPVNINIPYPCKILDGIYGKSILKVKNGCGGILVIAADSVLIRDLVFDGNKSNTSNMSALISVSGKHCIIERCIFRNAQAVSVGLSCTSGGSFLTIRDCIFEYSETVEANYVEAGGYFYSDSAYVDAHLIVDNCVFRDSTGNGCVEFDGRVRYGKITNNWCYQYGTDDSSEVALQADDMATDIEISSNRLFSINGGWAAGICAGRGGLNNIVTKNILKGSMPEGIVVTSGFQNDNADSLESSDCIISENIIDGALWGIFVNRGYEDGIDKPCSTFVVTSNIVKNSEYGIVAYLTNSTIAFNAVEASTTKYWVSDSLNNSFYGNR